MPLHECVHVPVTSCQRAEVKRVLHCDATASVDMDVFLSKDFLLLGYFLFNKYKFYTYFIQTLNSFNWFFSYTILYSFHIKISDRSNSHFLCLMSSMESISYFKTISVRDFHFDDNDYIFIKEDLPMGQADVNVNLWLKVRNGSQICSTPFYFREKP